MMELKNIRLIMVLVGLALLALTGVQLFWAYNAYRLHEKTFLASASESMNRTVKTMNDDLECFELFSKVHINPWEGIYMIRQKCDKETETFLKGQESIDTVPMYFAHANSNFPFDYNNLMFGVAANLEMTLRFRYLDESSQLDNTVNRHNEITLQNFREKFSDKAPVYEIYNTHKMDSLLRNEFGKAGISEHFHIAILNKTTNRIEYAGNDADTTLLMKSPFHARLTSSAYFSRPYELLLYFDNYEKMLFSGIRTGLIISLVIVSILLISFYIFIRIIFRQRKLSELKNDFINNMTHEFKTPLSNISVALETLSDENLKKNIPDKNIFSIIGQETERLRENVEKILHVARFEKEKIHLAFEKLDTTQVIQKAASSFDALLNNNGVSLSCDFKADNPCIYADETHLINVMCNLVDNSIKYSKNGHCEINIATANVKDGVMITVKDDGIGITRESQKRIFEKFYREPNGNLHNVKGFGLGLTYVKSIVDSHQGTISVSSRYGIGTAFEIYLPFNNGHSSNGAS